MKLGQTLRITANNAKGRIAKVSKTIGYIDISWQRRNNNGELYYDPTADRYDFPHIENLLKQGTLSMYNELPVEDPNVLFSKSKGEV